MQRDNNVLHRLRSIKKKHILNDHIIMHCLLDRDEA